MRTIRLWYRSKVIHWLQEASVTSAGPGIHLFIPELNAYILFSCSCKDLFYASSWFFSGSFILIHPPLLGAPWISCKEPTHSDILLPEPTSQCICPTNFYRNKVPALQDCQEQLFWWIINIAESKCWCRLFVSALGRPSSKGAHIPQEMEILVQQINNDGNGYSLGESYIWLREVNLQKIMNFSRPKITKQQQKCGSKCGSNCGSKCECASSPLCSTSSPCPQTTLSRLRNDPGRSQGQKEKIK